MALLGLLDGYPVILLLLLLLLRVLVPLSEPLVRSSHRSSRYEKEARAMLAE